VPTDPATLIAYTDGGCRGNPGPGAWAFLLVDPASGQARERAASVPDTTNNRMELSAVLEALSALRRTGSAVRVHADSRYVIDCCSRWLPGWKARGWRRPDGALKNVDLLRRLDELLAMHQVSWEWVPGHRGDPGNEHVDGLVNQCLDAIAAGEPATIDRRRNWP
jgi:ribonuclease HI